MTEKFTSRWPDTPAPVSTLGPGALTSSSASTKPVIRIPKNNVRRDVRRDVRRGLRRRDRGQRPQLQKNRGARATTLGPQIRNDCAGQFTSRRVFRFSSLFEDHPASQERIRIFEPLKAWPPLPPLTIRGALGRRPFGKLSTVAGMILFTVTRNAPQCSTRTNPHSRPTGQKTAARKLLAPRNHSLVFLLQ